MGLGQVPSQWWPGHEGQKGVGRPEEEQDEEDEGGGGGGTWHVCFGVE